MYKTPLEIKEDYSSGFEILVNDSSLLIGPLKFSLEKLSLSLISSMFLQCESCRLRKCFSSMGDMILSTLCG